MPLLDYCSAGVRLRDICELKYAQRKSTWFGCFVHTSKRAEFLDNAEALLSVLRLNVLGVFLDRARLSGYVLTRDAV